MRVTMPGDDAVTARARHHSTGEVAGTEHKSLFTSALDHEPFGTQSGNGQLGDGLSLRNLHRARIA